MFRIKREEQCIAFALSARKELIPYLLHDVVKQLNELACGDLWNVPMVLRELVDNAIVHGSAHGVQQEVSGSIRLYDDGQLEICVQDQGEGFDHLQLQARLAQELQQGRDCGLCLVQALTQRIEFNDKGNEVRVYLEVVRGDRVEQEESPWILSDVSVEYENISG